MIDPLYSFFFAILFMGILAFIFFIKSGSWLFSTPPKHKALHLTPFSAQYVATYLVSPIKPVLITEYVTGFTGCRSSDKSLLLYKPWSGAIKPRSDEIFIILPPDGFFEISVPKYLIHKKLPFNPTFRSSFQFCI